MAGPLLIEHCTCCSFMPQTKALGFTLITSMNNFTLSETSPIFSAAMPIFFELHSLRVTAWPALSSAVIAFCSSLTVLSLLLTRSPLSSRQSPTSTFISTMASEAAFMAPDADAIACCVRVSNPGISDSARLRRTPSRR